MLICDGPMTYMLGYRLKDDVLKASIRNMSEIIGRGFLQEMIIDHHLLRDLEWRSRMRSMIDWADTCGVRIYTAAAYMGLNESLLEANRRRLYEELGGKM
jgi:predicted metallo-beta-lactamase superfamily hydrolase